MFVSQLSELFNGFYAMIPKCLTSIFDEAIRHVLADMRMMEDQKSKRNSILRICHQLY